MTVFAPPDEVRVLVVADWRVDPLGMIDACRRRAQRSPVRFALLVPAWLHGLDWVGDPYASRPRAERQLASLAHLAAAARLVVDSAHVGDPDPATAVHDALARFRAQEIVLGERRRPLAGHPFDLAHRLRRSTGVPVTREAISARFGRGVRAMRGEALTGPMTTPFPSGGTP